MSTRVGSRSLIRLLTAIVTIVTVVLASWLVADTLDSAVSVHLGEASASTPPSVLRVAALGTPVDGDRAIAVIIKQNIFEHGMPPPDEGTAPGTAALPSGGCSLPVDVLSAVLVPKDSSRSLITLRDRGVTPATIDVYQRGDRIRGASLDAIVPGEDFTIAAVEFVFDDGHRERCTSSPRGVASTAVATALPPAPGGPARVELSEDDVSRALSGGMSAIVTSARALPAIENGVPIGYRISGIVPGSIAAKTGLVEGDVVRRVNGYDVKTPEDALRLATVLRNERNVSVDLVRAGRAQTLEIAVR